MDPGYYAAPIGLTLKSILPAGMWGESPGHVSIRNGARAAWEGSQDSSWRGCGSGRASSRVDGVSRPQAASVGVIGRLPRSTP